MYIYCTYYSTTRHLRYSYISILTNLLRTPQICKNYIHMICKLYTYNLLVNLYTHYIYIYNTIYCKQICLLFLNQPISSRREEETKTFIMKKEPFILENRCSFLLADIVIFIDFLVSENKKTKMCSVDSCRSSIFKKDEEKQSKKFDCPVHQIPKCKKKTKFFQSMQFLHPWQSTY